MTVRFYNSADSGAPTLTGEIGSLIFLLDACLVNGYGSQPAAGWTKAFSGTNKAAYRQGAGSSQLLCRIDDTASGTGGAKEALCRGYEAMTDVDTGSGLFPTAVQLAGGLVVRKSVTADNSVRQWYVLADETVFYLFTFSGDLGNYAQTFTFGDLESFTPGDMYACLIMGRITQNQTLGQEGGIFSLATGVTVSSSGHWLARLYTQVGASATAGKTADGAHFGLSIGATRTGSAGFAYPFLPSGGLLLGRVYVHEVASSVPRGVLKGMWNPYHNRPLGLDEQVTGEGGLNGRVMRNIFLHAPSTSCCILAEISDTW